VSPLAARSYPITTHTRFDWQVLVVSAAWIHGCVGLHTWLRLRPWWPKAAGFVYPLVFLVPILALLGFVEAGKGALALLNGGDQDWAQANADATVRFAAISPRLLLIQDIFLAVYAAPVVSAIAPFIARARRQRWHGRGRHGIGLAACASTHPAALRSGGLSIGVVRRIGTGNRMLALTIKWLTYAEKRLARTQPRRRRIAI
jgi:hypothetical protein